MQRVLISAVALTVLLAAPAFALVTSTPLPAQGITPAEMAQLLAQHQMTPKLTQGADGQPIVDARSAGVGFDVSFGGCHDGRCQDIYFEVGWSNAKGNAQLTPERINAWNSRDKFLRASMSPDNTLWAAMDARVAYGSTANAEEYIVLWAERLHAFKSFMGL